MTSFFWFRRDLRLEDNAGLYHALKSGHKVQCVFIFDRNILDKLEDRDDARVTFIHDQLHRLALQLKQYQANLITIYDTPMDAWKKLIDGATCQSVFLNHDYEPYARSRDDQVKALLNAYKISFHSFKDQVIFEKNEICKDNGDPYTIFTPYKNRYLSKLNISSVTPFDTVPLLNNLATGDYIPLVSLDEMGFTRSNLIFPGNNLRETFLHDYKITRDYPGLEGTSRLGVHLRFGTISIRQIMREAMEQKSESFINELVWREFYQMILWNFPYVTIQSFRKAFDKIKWRNNETEFELWCKGQTGYPLVDAGMRELESTGFMHNRVRMVAASFLTKHLLIDWRWGEAWFARKLLDYDLASNNGGWQWAAGCGTDAAPYFRIFNPTGQIKKFDRDLVYVRKWIPELDESTYPMPVVEHKFARERCLRVFKAAQGG